MQFPCIQARFEKPPPGHWRPGHHSPIPGDFLTIIPVSREPAIDIRRLIHSPLLRDDDAAEPGGDLLDFGVLSNLQQPPNTVMSNMLSANSSVLPTYSWLKIAVGPVGENDKDRPVLPASARSSNGSLMPLVL